MLGVTGHNRLVRPPARCHLVVGGLGWAPGGDAVAMISEDS